MPKMWRLLIDRFSFSWPCAGAKQQFQAIERAGPTRGMTRGRAGLIESLVHYCQNGPSGGRGDRDAHFGLNPCVLVRWLDHPGEGQVPGRNDLLERAVNVHDFTT